MKQASTLALLALLLFASACAHQIEEDNDFAANDEYAAEANSQDAIASIGSGEPSQEATPEQAADFLSGEFPQQPSQELASTEPNDSISSDGALSGDPSLEQQMEEGGYPETQIAEDNAVPADIPEASASETVASAAPELVTPESNQEASEMPAAQELVADNSEASMDSQTADAGIETDKSNIAAKEYPKSEAPKVAHNPVDQNGSWLNRYYIVREKDSTESVAQLLYDNAAKQEELKKWNANAKFKAGDVVYYASPLQPADSEMRSFQEERGVIASGYTVAKGDTLSEIAKVHYGSINSWKEIAVLNGVERPDHIDVGLTLALYPKELATYALNTQSAAPSKTAEAPIANAEPKGGNEEGLVDPVESLANLQAEMRELEARQPDALAANEMGPQPEERIQQAQNEPKQASFELANFLRKNWFALLALIAAGGLAIFYFVIKRNREPSMD